MTTKEIIEANGGIKNFRCFVKMGKIETITPFGFCIVNENENTWTECYIDESRYNVDDGYKITLRSVDPHFSYEHYYQEDFESSIRDGCILIKESDSQCIKRISFIEPLCGCAFIRHEADIVI